MYNLEKYTKSELVEIASWYGVELPSSMLKSEMIENVEVILNERDKEEENETKEIQMSVRVKRIKEQNDA